MSEVRIISLRCPRCGNPLGGEEQDVVFWCRPCAVPYEVAGSGLVERLGNLAGAAAAGIGPRLYLPLWAFRVAYACRWEDPKRAAQAQRIPPIEWVYVTGFSVHNVTYFGDPGRIYTEKRVALVPEEPPRDGVPVVGCIRTLQDAQAYVEPHLLGIIDRRVDVTGLTIACTISETVFWGVPFFDQGSAVEDGILGLTIPTAALVDIGGIRACQRRRDG
jgi:hypothetical protein